MTVELRPRRPGTHQTPEQQRSLSGQAPGKWVNCKIPLDYATRLKVAAIYEGTTITAFLLRALKAEIERVLEAYQ